MAVEAGHGRFAFVYRSQATRHSHAAPFLAEWRQSRGSRWVLPYEELAVFEVGRISLVVQASIPNNAQLQLRPLVSLAFARLLSSCLHDRGTEVLYILPKQPCDSPPGLSTAAVPSAKRTLVAGATILPALYLVLGCLTTSIVCRLSWVDSQSWIFNSPRVHWSHGRATPRRPILEMSVGIVTAF